MDWRWRCDDVVVIGLELEARRRERSRELRLSTGLGSRQWAWRNLSVEVVADDELGKIEANDWERQHKGVAMVGIVAWRRETGGLCDRIEGCPRPLGLAAQLRSNCSLRMPGHLGSLGREREYDWAEKKMIWGCWAQRRKQKKEKKRGDIRE
ncbi:hypothetical protein M0R45_006864 [Rubus argutus]|uniref:Uncharacterized protein n=1 Tax=Rubus argutus TaxID=59490 RepID=A0AAW1YRR1_RUBAR